MDVTARAKTAESLSEFSKLPLSVLKISSIEHFLAKCCSQKSEAMTFYELRYDKYHSKAFNFDLKKLLPTSGSIYKHIKRVYYQCCIWNRTSSNESMFLDPSYYGYPLDDNETLIAGMSFLELPGDFPLPFTCGKYARNNICPLGLNKLVGCCQYFKSSKSECKKPKNPENL